MTADFSEAAAAVRAHQCPGECEHMRALLAAMQPGDVGTAAALLSDEALAGAVDAYAWDLAHLAVHCAAHEAPSAPHTAAHALLDAIGAHGRARDVLAALASLYADPDAAPPAVRLALLPRHLLAALRRTRFSTPAHRLANAAAIAESSLGIISALREAPEETSSQDDEQEQGQKQEQEQEDKMIGGVRCVSAEELSREMPRVGDAALEALCCDVCLPLAEAVKDVPPVSAVRAEEHAAWRRQHAHRARLVALVAVCAQEAAGSTAAPNARARMQTALARALAALHTDVAALLRTARDNQHGLNALQCALDDDEDMDGEEGGFDEEEDAVDAHGLCEEGELAWERREVAPYAQLVHPVAAVWLLHAAATTGTLPRAYRPDTLFHAVLPLLTEAYGCLSPQVLATDDETLDLFIPLGLSEGGSSSSQGNNSNKTPKWWRLGKEVEEGEDGAVAELAGAMLGAVVVTPDAQVRQTRHARFATVLEALAPETLFAAVRHVLGLPNRNSALRSVAVRELRRLVDRAWLPRPQDARLAPLFCSPRVRELLPLVCVHTSLADEHEAALEGINFYRYLLLRDSANHTGVWCPAHIAEVNSRFLIPLASEAQRLRARYDVGHYTSEDDARRDHQACLDGLRAAGLPDVSFDTFLRRNAQIATNMDLLLSLVERVQNIISSHEDSL